MEDRVVALGLLTSRDLDMLGAGFRRAFPLDGLDDFQLLLDAIDEAERESMADHPKLDLPQPRP